MSDDPADWPKLVKVAEGFYVREEVDVTAWIDLGDCALVVDALERSRLKAEVFEAIRSTLGEKPVKYVLNTHPHGDHTALNAAFERTFGAEIVNQRINPVPPEGRWFEGPRRRVQMLPMPGCHTAHDCVVWVPDDKALFEKLVLEGFQAGLSWITILKKRPRFREVFDGFEPETIAGYGPDKIGQLMADAGIVRNRLKIESTISNAQAYLTLRDEQSFASYLWGFVDGRPIQNRFETMQDIPADRTARGGLQFFRRFGIHEIMPPER